MGHGDWMRGLAALLRIRRGSSPGPWPRRRWIAVGGALGVGFVLYLGILLVLRSGPVCRALRARATAELAARLPGARLEGEVSVDAAFRPVMGPLLLPSPGDGAPLLVVDRIVIHPRLWRLFTGRLEVGEVALRGVHIHGGSRGQRLADLARALRPDKPQAARRERGTGAPPPVLAFSGLEVRLEDSSSRRLPLVVGPLEGSLRLDRKEGRTLAFLGIDGPGLGPGKGPGSGAGRMTGAVEAAWGGGPGVLRMHLHGLGPGTLPEALRKNLPFEIRSGAIDLSLDAPGLNGSGLDGSGLEAFSRGEGQFRLATRGLTLFAERLDAQPLSPPPLRVAGRLRWDAGARRAALEEATVTLDEAGRVALKAALSVAMDPQPSFGLELRAAGLDWTALAGTLPPRLAPPPGAPPIAGLLAGRLRMAGPLREPAEWQVDGAVDLSRLVPAQNAAPNATPSGGPNLARPFVHEAPLAGGGSRRVVIGPENPAFVPLGELPAHLVRAVLESEDAGFFGHQGFDLSEVQEALSSGGRLRGASTLTQQLAKNLFLSRDRTLSRKIREAFATLALEVAVGKRRILEIYLNLVEWGDGVNGIGEAARHWFGKDARALSPKEAIMLATVIPNPVRYEMYRRRGALTPAWEARVADLLEKLHASGALDDEAFRAAEAETLAFNVGPGSDQIQPDKNPENED